MNKIIKKAEKFAKKKYQEGDKYHNWQHVQDVLEVALKLSKHYPDADLEVLKLAIIFHDVDYTNPETHALDSSKIAEEFLVKLKYPQEKIEKIVKVILSHSSKQRKKLGDTALIEGKIIYDADKFRLACSADASEKFYKKLYLAETRLLVDEFMKKNNEKSKFKELEQQAGEYLAGWQRAQADYQNLQKQMVQEKADFVKYANANLIIELLQVYDNFKLAFNSVPEKEKESPWLKGLEYILKQWQDLLKNQNVEEIKTIGKKFDLSLHEAVDYKKDKTKKTGIILQEIKPGYKLNDKVIQVAKVVVNK